MDGTRSELQSTSRSGQDAPLDIGRQVDSTPIGMMWVDKGGFSLQKA